ncbi:MAG: radical SAM protein, partial [Myxococcota bacterium]
MSTVLDRPESRGALCRQLAQSQLSAGHVEAAVESFVQALQVDPAERDQATRLRIALADLGHTALAEPLVVALKSASERLYQRNVERLRLSPYVDYPQHVHLETLARCNARCTFCPSPTLARTGAKLGDEVIDKVLTDLQDIPSNLPFQLSPFKVNEPFLDVRLFDILEDIQGRLPNATLALTTNASPLTPKKLARLAAISPLRTLYVSFNDHRPDVYEQAMGIPYLRTVDRLDM